MYKTERYQLDILPKKKVNLHILTLDKNVEKNKKRSGLTCLSLQFVNEQFKS